jgi:hypothetical protein
MAVHFNKSDQFVSGEILPVQYRSDGRIGFVYFHDTSFSHGDGLIFLNAHLYLLLIMEVLVFRTFLQ